MLKDKSAVPVLRDVLRDERWEVRGRAAQALAELGEASTLAALFDLLRDEHWTVRDYAAKAIILIIETLSN